MASRNEPETAPRPDWTYISRSPEETERLGQWKKAALDFEAAAKPATSLAEEARRRQQWASRIAGILDDTSDAQNLEGFLNALQLRRTRLLQLREANPPHPYASFIPCELERAREEEAVFLFSNRLVLPKGLEQAVQAGQALVDENPQSFRRGENLLLLGGFYEALARDYVHWNDPNRGRFDSDRVSQWVERARATYKEVAQTDGDPAKPEGQARLRALDAFAQRVIQRGR